MQPLRIKASGTPITAVNYQGLQEMSDTEIHQYLSYVITNKFAGDSDGSGVAELNVDTANALTGTSIGTFTNTIRDDAIGTHPTDGAVTTNTYYFKQVNSTAAENITNRMVGYDAAIKEMTDSDLDTDILDKVIEDMVTENSYTVGQYKLSATTPSGGSWTSRYTITDTAQGGNNIVYLWQKTTPTSSANADLTSLKLDGTDVKGMSSAEIEQVVPNFRNRIISSGIGTYAVQTTAPGTGTWVQMGDAGGFSDTRQEVASDDYAGTYTGAYATVYSGNYVGAYTGAKTYAGSYTGSFSGNYAGNYVGTSAYSGTYAGAYATAFVLYYAGYVGGYFTGYFTGYYTGFYTGAKTYSGTYTGAYSQDFTGDYVGTSAYSGTYSGNYTGYYSGDYTGQYAGDTIQATTEDVTTVKLWIKTA
jgi:hypothetical protein